ncbi:MAG TPA: DUF5655 domain-containing protein [Bryobacteraceae bacterium]|nr:DUF5655 domain-containing protein [Bryobacteraceae bacterium]
MAEQTNALADASPLARRLYNGLLAALRTLGPFREEVKKTSIHLARASAFAGVRFGRQHLLLTLKAAEPISSPRVARNEQVSRNRWHVEVKLITAQDIDAQLLGWLQQAYDLCA